MDFDSFKGLPGTATKNFLLSFGILEIVIDHYSNDHDEVGNAYP